MQPRVHTSQTFGFTANARMAEAFALFGALREQVWAPEWTPRFIWPAPAEDCPGMVFQIERDGQHATWVNTVFDPAAGRVQYVYVLPDVVATVISIEMRDQCEDSTAVEVRYERTALSARSDAAVLAMGRQDAEAGPEWASQINGYLAARARSGEACSGRATCQATNARQRPSF